MAGQKDDDSASKTTIAVSKNEIRRFKASPAKLHLSLSSVAFGPNTSNAMGRAFQSSGFGGTEANWLFGGSITYPLDYSDPATWNIGVEYNLINKIRLGLSGHKIPKQEVIGKSEEKEIASGSSYQFSIDYVPKPCAPLLLSRLELSFGAGNSYNSFSIDGELRPSTDNSIFSWSEGAPTRVPFRIPARRVFGTHLKAAIDYYPARAFSFQFKIQRRTRPAIEVSEQKQTFEITTFSFLGHVIDKRSETKTLRKHTVDFSGVETSVGIRFHL